MFTADHIKGFILHPELHIVNTALEYFEESYLYEGDTTLMPLVIERLKQTKKGEGLRLFCTRSFPQTEDTISELRRLAQSRAMSPHTIGHINAILQLEDRRRSIADMSTKELEALFHSTEDAEVVNELARRNWKSPEEVLQELVKSDRGNSSYPALDNYIQLAGAMKLEAAIPALCEFLGSEDDSLPAIAVRSLACIGTPSVITTLTDRYLTAKEEYFHLFATDVFGRIKLPESEEAVLRLLPQEKDLTFATKLADALCKLGSSQGAPLVEDRIEKGYDSGYLTLTESYYAYCVISGTPHPSLAKWKAEIAAVEARIAKAGALMRSGFMPPLPQPPAPPAPPKIERNAPCPCGSGKKHKKCCGA